MQLFALGFLTLFQELVLIRYLAGNIWNLGFFPNLVLIAVFVGMGMGFLLHQLAAPRTSNRLFLTAVILLGGLVAFVTFSHPVVPGFGQWQGQIGDEVYFAAGQTGGRNNLLMFLLWFGLTVCIFACIAQRTAKLFRLYTPLHAYTLDIAGSCCGILAFMAASWLGLPAYLWFALLAPLYLIALDRRARSHLAATAAVFAGVTALAWWGDRSLLADPAYTGPLEVRWSPYQKLEYAAPPDSQHRVFVNGIAHQDMHAAEVLRAMFYHAPHRDRSERQGLPPYRRALIIGAGSGNDVQAALQNGVGSVTAVEIDPEIYELGVQYHPAQPYDDPRVRVTIDDGRAVLTRANDSYDLIIFALTDSLVKVSPMAQLRLENYLFTREAAMRAYSLLAEHGDLVYYNYYRTPWLAEKIREMLYVATGRAPQTIWERDGLSMLKVTRTPGPIRPPSVPAMQFDIPEDDWPFLYLYQRGIPQLYLGVMAGFVVFVVGLMGLLRWLGRRAGSELRGLSSTCTKLAFLFMGVAFLLLETKSVIQFSLLFGTTWLNNSLVFLGVLVLVLAANWAAWLLPSRGALTPVFVLLLLSCLLGMVYPLANLLYFPNAVLRFVLASLLTFTPIFFANLIFSITFRDQRVPEHMFGWNLIGATLGGMAEYLSMAVGYNALAVVVAICYTLVFVMLVIARRTAALAAH